jgi:hypothetical protein
MEHRKSAFFSSFPSSGLGTHLSWKLQLPHACRQRKSVCSRTRRSWSFAERRISKSELGNEGARRSSTAGGAPALQREQHCQRTRPRFHMEASRQTSAHSPSTRKRCARSSRAPLPRGSSPKNLHAHHFHAAAAPKPSSALLPRGSDPKNPLAARFHVRGRLEIVVRTPFGRKSLATRRDWHKPAGDPYFNQPISFSWLKTSFPEPSAG